MDLLKRMKEILMYLYGKISKTLSEKSKVNISPCVNNKKHIHILTHNPKYKQEYFLEKFSENIRNL